MSRKLSVFIVLLSLLFGSCQSLPTIVPTNTTAPLITTSIPLPVSTSTQKAPISEWLPGPLEISPATVSLQSASLGDAHVSLVPEQPFDDTSGPRIMGLPAHIAIQFGDTPEPLYYGEYPILTIIPIEPYRQMWAENGDPIIDTLFTGIQDLIANPPTQAPTSQLPILPLDAVQAVIDIAAQFKPLDSDQMQGYRFVGRLSQGINPVINANLFYFYMGLSRDGQYIINMMVPVKSSALVDRMEDFPAADNDLLNSDYMQYMQVIRDRLNQQPGSEFGPELERLDSVVTSLNWQGK